MSTASGQGEIVVGVDGSPGGAAALSWALDEARLHGYAVHVIYAFPALVSYFGTTAHEYFPQVEKEAAAAFERATADVPNTDGVEIRRSMVPGNPSEKLVEASSGARLLVVGSRGVGAFRGMLLGSVSTHCVHHAHCPVVVIRHQD
jgi:nucleotide-binding universal stress UspA family protein